MGDDRNNTRADSNLDDLSVDTDFNLTNKLAIAHLNVRSLNTGFDEFCFYVTSYQFDIIGLSETWLTPVYDSNMFQIPGYVFIRMDRDGRGGGVGFYIKKTLTYSVVTFDQAYSSDFEYIAIKSVVDKKNILLLDVYRPPSGNIETFLSTLEDILSVTVPFFDHVVVLGDININFLSNDLSKIKLLNLLGIFNMRQLITEPTRFNLTSNNSSLIDVVMANQELDFVKSDSVPISRAVTDHNLVYVIFNLRKTPNTNKIIKCRNYKNIDFAQFHNEAEQLQWNRVYYTNNIENKLEIFNKNILYLINKYAPLHEKRVKDKTFNPWITDNIKHLMHLRDKAHKTYLKNKTPGNLQYYRQLRNFTKHAITREKISYFNQFSSIKGKEFWKNASKLNITRNKTVVVPNDLCDPGEINNFFSTSFQGPNSISHEKLAHYSSTVHPNVVSEFNITLMDDETLLNILDNISTGAIGDDGISVRDLKLCIPYCLGPLLNIINSCILESYFPYIWKRAVVKPLAKIMNPREFKDLRPISILSVVSKIIEKHVNNQLYDFLNSSSLIPNCQSGFRPNFSTSTCLVNLLNDIRHNEDKKEITCLALLDFSKAFDTLNHEMLLAKLHYFGLSKKSIEFFKQYLKDRSVCVEVLKNQKLVRSSYLPTFTGVPQGSILGPLLFSIYVADMSNCVQNSKIQQYADDSQVYTSFPLDSMGHCLEQFNNDLGNLRNFAEDHNLKLNPSKSCILFFNHKSSIDSVTRSFVPKIDDTPLTMVTEAKNLGVILDESLSFRPHVNNKLKIAYMRLKSLNKYKKFLPSKIKYKLCDSLILSLFDYGDVAYSSSLTLQLSHQVQKLQNSCMRFSYNIPFRNHITPYLNENNILNMSYRRKHHLYNFVYRIIKTGQPPYLKLLFNSFLHEYNTRYVNNYRVPRHRTAAFQKSFIYSAVHMWNGLPDHVKEFSPKRFSKYVKDALLYQQKYHSY